MIWLLGCHDKDGVPPPADTTDSAHGVDSGGSDGGPVPLELTALGYSLHPQIGTLVYARWTQTSGATVHVEYTIDGSAWMSSPARERDAGEHEELLLGIPYATEVQWRAVAADNAASTEPHPASTAPPPPGLPSVAVTVNEPAGQDGAAWFLVGLANGGAYSDSWWTVIVDRQGRPVWALLSPPDRTSRQARIARDGRSLLVDRSSFFPELDQGEDSVVEQILLDGSVLHTWATPGMHHPFTDLPDGTIAYGRSVGWLPGSYPDEELALVHLDGTTETLWTCSAFVASIGASAECMSNTLNYDPPTNDFFFSFFTSETVVRIDRDTGGVVAWYGHLPGAYAFDPPESAFWWQHGGHLTADGTFLTSSDLDSDGTETVVREYAVDEATQTLREVWNLGVGDGIYGWQLGEALRLDNGNTLQNFGRLARLREATPAGDTVWDLAWDSTGLGHSFPVPDLYALAPAPTAR